MDYLLFTSTIHNSLAGLLPTSPSLGLSVLSIFEVRYPPQRSFPYTKSKATIFQVFHLSMQWDSKQLLLVGGFNHLEQYESQWEGLSHI